MAHRNVPILALLLLLATGGSACSRLVGSVVELRHYPVQDTDGLIDTENSRLDIATSSDGNGSLRIDVRGPVTVALFETGDIDIENTTLVYRAKVRTAGLEGRAYLEMWCVFSDTGQYFSRGLNSPVSGDTDWSTEEIPFFLKSEQNPDNVKLNLVIEGRGTVWIDDIRLLASRYTE